MRSRLVVITLLSFILFSSCNYFSGKRIDGSGNVVTQTRNVAGYTSVDVSGSMDVYVKQDSAFSVKVETDDNLQEYILVEERDGTLRIHQENNTNLNTSKKIKVYVSGPNLHKFYASGACNFIGDTRITVADNIDIHLSGSCDATLDLKAPGITADMSGASSLKLRGATKDFDADGSGSTDLKCFDLLTENTTISFSGAGDAEVYASVKLDVELSGSASVLYKGSASVNQSVSGSSSVKKVE